MTDELNEAAMMAREGRVARAARKARPSDELDPEGVEAAARAVHATHWQRHYEWEETGDPDDAPPMTEEYRQRIRKQATSAITAYLQAAPPKELHQDPESAINYAQMRDASNTGHTHILGQPTGDCPVCQRAAPLREDGSLDDTEAVDSLWRALERSRDKAEQWDAAQPMIAAMTGVVEAARIYVEADEQDPRLEFYFYQLRDALATTQDPRRDEPAGVGVLADVLANPTPREDHSDEIRENLGLIATQRAVIRDRERLLRELIDAVEHSDHVYNADGSDSPACDICQAARDAKAQLNALATTTQDSRDE